MTPRGARTRPVPNFDRLARAYERLERLVFGAALWRRRICYLEDPRIASAKRALVLGEGDGRFLATLAARYPSLELTAIDSSPAMVREQRARLTRAALAGNVDLQCADLRGWTPQRAGYDLIVSHFAFDCFTSDEVSALVQRIAPALARDARWLVSEFALPDAGLRRWLWALVIHALYFAQRSLTGLELDRVPNYAAALRAAGFQLASVESEFGGGLCSQLWQRG